MATIYFNTFFPIINFPPRSSLLNIGFWEISNRTTRRSRNSFLLRFRFLLMTLFARRLLHFINSFLAHTLNTLYQRLLTRKREILLGSFNRICQEFEPSSHPIAPEILLRGSTELLRLK